MLFANARGPNAQPSETHLVSNARSFLGGGCSWLELTRPLAVKTETVVSEQLGFIKGVYLSVLGICSSYRQAVTVL